MDTHTENLNGGAAPDPGLPRVLGMWDIVGIVIGGIVGSGIFLVPAAIAAETNAPLVFMAVWVVGGLLSFFGALSFAELGAAYPQAGGMYVYLREAYGSLIPFLFGWALFLVIDSGAVATLAVAFSSKYLPYFFSMSWVAQKAVAVVFVAVLVTVNYLGVRKGADLQNVLTIFKFAALAGICVVVFVFGKGSTSNFVSPGVESFNWGLLGGFGLALVHVLWAYKGWEAATYSVGETRNPGKNLPWGLFIGTVAVLAIYLVTNLAYLYLFPTSQIAGSDRIASDVMSQAIGPAGATIVAVIILFSITGAANQVLLTSPRVYYAMAKDGLFFKRTADVHPRFLTPHVAILAIGGWSIILSLSGTFEQLLTYVIFGQWIFFALTTGAVIILRRRKPDLPRPYRVFGYPFTPVIFILSALFITFNTLINQFWNAMAGLIIIMVGLPFYVYWKKKGA